MPKFVKHFMEKLDMVSLLVCSKDITEANILCGELANDENYCIENLDNVNDALSRYLQIKPDILVLDTNLSNESVKDILDRLSACPLESQKCNTILTLPTNCSLKLNNVSKIHTIINKPITNNELVNTIKNMSNDFNTPNLEVGEIDWLLQILDFNCVSPGYTLMKDAITYCYYRPHTLDLLNNVLKHLAYKYDIPETRVRDCLKSCIRPFNNKNHNMSNELFVVLHNNGNKLSLKDFLERIVFYLIKVKKKGRMF